MYWLHFNARKYIKFSHQSISIDVRKYIFSPFPCIAPAISKACCSEREHTFSFWKSVAMAKESISWPSSPACISNLVAYPPLCQTLSQYKTKPCHEPYRILAHKDAIYAPIEAHAPIEEHTLFEEWKYAKYAKMIHESFW